MLAGGISSSPHWPLYNVLGVSSEHGRKLSAGANDPRVSKCGQSGSCSIFCNLVSKVTYHHFCHMLLATQLKHSTLREGMQRGLQGSLGHSWELLSGKPLTHTQGIWLTLAPAFEPGKLELMKERLGKKDRTKS